MVRNTFYFDCTCQTIYFSCDFTPDISNFWFYNKFLHPHRIAYRLMLLNSECKDAVRPRHLAACGRLAPRSSSSSSCTSFLSRLQLPWLSNDLGLAMPRNNNRPHRVRRKIKRTVTPLTTTTTTFFVIKRGRRRVF